MEVIRVAPIPTTGGRAAARRLLGLVVGGLLAACLAVPALAGPALLQDSKAEAPVDLRRLQFEYRCFFSTPGWKGKEDEFLRRLRAQHAAYAASAKDKLPAFEDLMARALWDRSEAFFAAGDLKSASERASEILGLESDEGLVKELKPKADERTISYSLAEAKRFENEEKNDGKAWEAYTTCLRTRNDAALKDVMAGMTRIALRRNGYDAVKASNSLAEEGRTLQRILGELAGVVPAQVLDKGWPDIQVLKDRLTQIEESTGHVLLSFLDVSGPLKGYKGGAAALTLDTALLRFVPRTDGQAWPAGKDPAKAPGPDLLLIRGTYDVQVFAPGSDTPAALWAGVPVGKAPFALEIPGRAPEGMVYVGPWQGGGGFFVDRTEVTVGQVRAAAKADPGLKGLEAAQEKTADNVPAWFMDDKLAEDDAKDAAVKFAASVGKRVPTLKQWSDAAFGPAGAAYPWGSAAPDPAKHLVSGAGEPQPVGSRPAGASPYGCLDMAGNVMEWVEGPGGMWAIGGSYAGALDKDGFDRMHNPIPGSTAYERISNQAEKDKYLKVKDSFEDFWTTGLRLVIPVK